MSGVGRRIDRWMIAADADCRQTPDTEQVISRSCHRQDTLEWMAAVFVSRGEALPVVEPPHLIPAVSSPSLFILLQC